MKKKNGSGIAQSDFEKAEEFNGQFTDVFTKTVHNQVPLLDRSAPFMDEIVVTKEGVTKLLKGLNPSKALGPDELHPRVLKELAKELGPVFAHLFQQSINTGEIPREWSLANICPLFQKGDRSLACNYRPVSLTCIPCKLLEHIVCSNIMGHLDQYNLLSDKHHAFRKWHSFETQLITVKNDWAKILDKKGQVDTFILDFEKAFDTPPHELLKSKLFSYGIGGKTLEWINAFLCFRQQRVVVNGVKSDWAPVVSGVPQGTVLGPLLFSLYINDIPVGIDSQIRLFADDCVCYREIKTVEDTLKLQKDIDLLGSWARKWGMRFQPVKCNMMQLTNKRINKIEASYTLEGTVLENVDSIKYLGVTITNDLKWNTHINNICTKANRTFGFLRRNLFSCPQHVKEAAYKGLVRPVLEYGSSVWDPHTKCKKTYRNLILCSESSLTKLGINIKEINPPQFTFYGDFNFGEIVWPDRHNKCGSPMSRIEGQILVDIINDHGFDQLVHFPTRERNTLDLIITSLPNQFVDIHSPDCLSDHDIVSGTLKIVIPPIKKPRRKVYRYQKGDYESMRAETLKFAKEKYFNGYSDTRSVQENFNLITSFIQDSADKHIPSKTSRSVSSVPWITPDIRRKIRRKNITHAKAKKTGSANIRSKFENLRREIKADIRKQHDLYVNNLVGDVKANPRDFYRYINSQRKDTQGIPPLKKKNGSGIAQSDFEKAEEFNGQFTDVFTKTVHNQVPLLDRSAPFMDEIVVTKEGVTKLLKGLNPSKALGPDELHPRVLKELAKELGPVFAHLFQQSINTGEIPREWSLANICPLFKKGDRSLACNYRPVSLTCIPCKLLEHIV